MVAVPFIAQPAAARTDARPVVGGSSGEGAPHGAGVASPPVAVVVVGRELVLLGVSLGAGGPAGVVGDADSVAGGVVVAVAVTDRGGHTGVLAVPVGVGADGALVVVGLVVVVIGGVVVAGGDALVVVLVVVGIAVGLLGAVDGDVAGVVGSDVSGGGADDGVAPEPAYAGNRALAEVGCGPWAQTRGGLDVLSPDVRATAGVDAGGRVSTDGGAAPPGDTVRIRRRTSAR